MLATLFATAFGVSLPVFAEPPHASRVERAETLRGAQRAHRRAHRRHRRRQARIRRRQAQRRRAQQRRAQHRRPHVVHPRHRVRVTAQPPVIVGVPQPVVVAQMGFDVQQAQQQAVVLTAGAMPAPYSMPGFVVGQVPSRQLGLPDSCPGFWAQQPQHIVTLPAGMPYFRIDVLSGTDTTLAIVTPDGQVWCNDDGGEGRNPRLEGQFPAGTYAVYVGTYQRGYRASYTAQLSERPVGMVQGTVAVQGPVAVQAPVAVGVQTPTVGVQVSAQPTYAPRGYPAPVVYAQAAPPPPPSCRSVLLERGYHPSLLTHCEGAEPYCAAALLRAGHHPSNLVHCQDVPPRCAVTLLERGHHPSNLVHCEGAEPACAEQVLRSGQHPSSLVHCQ